jgi:hypothetical protein
LLDAARPFSPSVGRAPRHGATTRLVIDLALGRRSYRDVRRRIVVRAPLLASRLLWERWRN